MTTVYLCQIPQFSTDYKNVGNFTSRTNQINYMQRKCILNLTTNAKIDNFTDSITLNYTINTNMRKCDYLYAQGSDGRYFFFFITNMEQNIIQNKIYQVRGVRVMLDFDLAELYQVETKRLKEAVRRNWERFEGDDFMFELTEQELADIADDYRYSEAYCAMDIESVLYFIEKRKDE